jgi:hypothetical protein
MYARVVPSGLSRLTPMTLLTDDTQNLPVEAQA